MIKQKYLWLRKLPKDPYTTVDVYLEKKGLLGKKSIRGTIIERNDAGEFLRFSDGKKVEKVPYKKVVDIERVPEKK